ncbi:hypothetical protein [Streptomyces sp. NBC_00140]|uniref:hypothetical protein n=1 Tax=Streptomyces sp. NBC_00140 TaxID=2975664 RepID=UPI00225890A5|nr:hypothetical protein [Streptomyces sp. NBC_00140]MCX5328159.1 hypothetical protein [Streptomyces sp. NBC_00140]
MARLEEAQSCEELPSGLGSDATSRYMLQEAHPDATPDLIEEGVSILAQTTLAEIGRGEPLSMDSIYDAAKQLEAVFPTPAIEE